MIRKTLAIYWRIMRPHKRLWLTAVLLSTVFFAGLNIAMPWAISRFIGELSSPEGKSIADYTWFLWVWAGIRLLVFALGRIQIYIHFWAITRTLRDIDLKSFRTTLSHSNDFFANNFTGSLVTKFNRFTRSFDILANAVMFDLTSLSVQAIFPFVIFMFIAPTIGIILLVWTIIFVVVLIYLHKMKIPLARKVSSYDSEVTGVVADTVTNALSVKMFASFSSEYSAFKSLSQKRLKARFKNLIYNDFIRVYKIISIIILQILVFYFSIKFAIEGTLKIADILLIEFYIQQLTMSLWNFGKLVEKLEEAVADATEMTEIYNLKPSVTDVKNPAKFENIKGQIRLDSVSFAYEGDHEQTVFNKICINIPAGQKIGFVGPSGGGKTTLTKLLLRLMDVDSGTISIDGQDISKITQDDLRRNIAYVPQEPLLFHRSIYNNILYGNPDATKEEVIKASELAHADEFVNKLPYGYETLVGERGVKLSGGQKQRVAIARAMLKKSQILILDEATSALDSKSEKLITNALDTLMEKRTTIVIAHRLSTIKKMDRIVVLTEEGVVEDGTHGELLKQKGLYSELWHHQHDDFL